MMVKQRERKRERRKAEGGLDGVYIYNDSACVCVMWWDFMAEEKGKA